MKNEIRPSNKLILRAFAITLCLAVSVDATTANAQHKDVNMDFKTIFPRLCQHLISGPLKNKIKKLFQRSTFKQHYKGSCISC